MANASLSREHVLDELEFLATVEHALIVEYLAVCCALGHDLEAGRAGRPPNRVVPGRASPPAAIMAVVIRQQMGK